MPWKLIYTEECPDKKTARVREKYLKTTSGKKIVLKKLHEKSQVKNNKD